MDRYQITFAALKDQKRLAFTPFWMIGDPDLVTSQQVIELLAEKSDILELGLPFSDPLADGPTIQAAVNRSLAAGATTEKCFKIIENIREKYPQKPIGLLVYLNLVMQFGIDAFFERCQQAGVDSVLIPELPIEEVSLVKASAEKAQIHLVFLCSTNTPVDRQAKIFEASGGFVYTVSTPSITGAKTELSPDTLRLVEHIKGTTKLPVCVGFGISTPEHLTKLKDAGADGGIIGSELINIYQKGGLEVLKDFLEKCQAACR